MTRETRPTYVPLADRAHERAVNIGAQTYGVAIREGVDWHHEAGEELADLYNYVGWFRDRECQEQHHRGRAQDILNQLRLLDRAMHQLAWDARGYPSEDRSLVEPGP